MLSWRNERKNGLGDLGLPSCYKLETETAVGKRHTSEETLLPSLGLFSDIRPCLLAALGCMVAVNLILDPLKERNIHDQSYERVP